MNSESLKGTSDYYYKIITPLNSETVLYRESNDQEYQFDQAYLLYFPIERDGLSETEFNNLHSTLIKRIWKRRTFIEGIFNAGQDQSFIEENMFFLKSSLLKNMVIWSKNIKIYCKRKTSTLFNLQWNHAASCAPLLSTVPITSANYNSEKRLSLMMSATLQKILGNKIEHRSRCDSFDHVILGTIHSPHQRKPRVENVKSFLVRQNAEPIIENIKQCASFFVSKTSLTTFMNLEYPEVNRSSSKLKLKSKTSPFSFIHTLLDRGNFGKSKNLRFHSLKDDLVIKSFESGIKSSCSRLKSLICSPQCNELKSLVEDSLISFTTKNREFSNLEKIFSIEKYIPKVSLSNSYKTTWLKVVMKKILLSKVLLFEIGNFGVEVNRHSKYLEKNDYSSNTSKALDLCRAYFNFTSQDPRPFKDILLFLTKIDKTSKSFSFDETYGLRSSIVLNSFNLTQNSFLAKSFATMDLSSKIYNMSRTLNESRVVERQKNSYCSESRSKFTSFQKSENVNINRYSNQKISFENPLDHFMELMDSKKRSDGLNGADQIRGQSEFVHEDVGVQETDVLELRRVFSTAFLEIFGIAVKFPKSRNFDVSKARVSLILASQAQSQPVDHDALKFKVRMDLVISFVSDLFVNVVQHGIVWTYSWMKAIMNESKIQVLVHGFSKLKMCLSRIILATSILYENTVTRKTFCLRRHSFLVRKIADNLVSNQSDIHVILCHEESLPLCKNFTFLNF